jgi:hypothetical protein
MTVTIQNKNTNGMKKIRVPLIEGIMLIDLMWLHIDLNENDVIEIRR